jgi:hypothetical protein
LGLTIVSAIFGAGLRSGVALEHNLEAGRREAIQGELIQCQNETKAFREAEAFAQRELREAQERLAILDRDRLDYAEQRADQIESALQRALNGFEPNANCALTATDVDGLRDILGPRPGGGD